MHCEHKGLSVKCAADTDCILVAPLSCLHKAVMAACAVLLQNCKVCAFAASSDAVGLQPYECREGDIQTLYPLLRLNIESNEECLWERRAPQLVHAQ